MTTKAKATAPGQPTLHVEVTPTEQAQLDTEASEWTALEVTRIITNIKIKAGALIVSVFPEWKQRNAIARSVDLVYTNGAITDPEYQELQDLQDIWAWVTSVRTHSGTLEAAVLASNDPSSINIDAGWPDPIVIT